jgi:hypothetical protein
MTILSKHAYPNEEPRDCVLYVIARKSDENIKITDDGKSVRIKVEDVDVLKYLYIGITSDFDVRMTSHKCNVLNPEYEASRKFYNRIKAHGWDAYEKRVLVTGLTRTEAKKLEIETIDKYRTFEFGLNSTPGGDGCGSGADHPRAQAVNLYNNVTGEITSFMWMGAAAAFLGYKTSETSGVSKVANPNCDEAQIQSLLTDEWFQVRYAYDTTPFEKNMPTRDDKVAEALRKAIWVFNMTTKTEYKFDGTDLAVVKLGVGKDNIRNVFVGDSTHFNVPTGEYAGRYDAQRDPKTREWKTDVPSQYEAHEKAVVAYDENDVIVCRYDSATKAGDAERISRSGISSCARHHPKHSYAGKKGGHELRWEFEDPKLRAEYDRDRPRKLKKPKKPFYYVTNGVNVYFKTQTEAVEKTRGKIPYGTQSTAIAVSIKSKGTKSCKAGYIWFKM